MKLWNDPPGRCDEIPQITPFIPKEKKSAAAVVIFPGGAYAMRAEHEGVGYAEFLSAHGITAFVVDYRVAPHSFPLPLLDARRAVRFVRAHAAEYGVEPAKVAVMGSSAGGHLAALTATFRGELTEERTDAIDTLSPYPNAQILCYPVTCSPTVAGEISHAGSYENLIGCKDEAMEKALDPYLLADDNTPPAFIWHTADDDAVNVVGSYLYATALKEKGVSTEMHIFPSGRHGLGLAQTEAPHVAQWSRLLLNWLAYIGWLETE